MPAKTKTSVGSKPKAAPGGQKGKTSTTAQKPKTSTSALKPKTSTTAQKPKASTPAPADPKVETKEPAIEEGTSCTLRQLANVFEDRDRKIRDGAKWPLLIDPSGNGTTFLRYRNVNYLCALNSNEMDPERIRMALVGAIKCGKPLVIDIDSCDLLDSLTTFFDQVEKGLLDQLMTKQLMVDDGFMRLVKDTDPDNFKDPNDIYERVKEFMFIIATKSTEPQKALMQQVYPVRITEG